MKKKKKEKKRGESKRLRVSEHSQKPRWISEECYGRINPVHVCIVVILSAIIQINFELSNDKYKYPSN